jgi:DNA-binding LacI/PurR family transcriptional regulator/ABC-type glycerol-3-phosphate transport system substrate-binding protein
MKGFFMATIYDVAKKAGVSISTVSNYINKTKYTSPVKNKKIQFAIDELNFFHKKNDNNKDKITSQIYIILPSLDIDIYKKVYTEISEQIPDKYSLIPYLTNDIPKKETEIISRAKLENAAGIILCTCQPGNTELFCKLIEDIPVVFILRKPDLNKDYSFAGFNNSNSVYSIIDILLKNKIDNIFLITGLSKFSYEQDLKKGFIKAFHENNKNVSKKIIFESSLNSLSLVKLLSDKILPHSPPKVIITSNSLFVDTIKKASAINSKDIFVIYTGSEALLRSYEDKLFLINNNTGKLAGKTAETLIMRINNAGKDRHSNINPDFSIEQLEWYINLINKYKKPKKPKVKNKVKILLPYNRKIIHALEFLKPDFIKKHGIDIEIDVLKYNVYADTLIEMCRKNSTEYDIYSISKGWIETMDKLKYIKASEFETSHNKTVPRIPYKEDTQILFYRKDIFENPMLKRDFELIYNKELLPPTTWEEYNVIAAYFTKSYNKNSPVDYGHILSLKEGLPLANFLYPRIAGILDEISDINGRLNFLSDTMANTIKNFLICISYSPENSFGLSLDNAFNIFKNGNIAMIPVFLSYINDIHNDMNSNFHSNTGFKTLPCEKTVLNSEYFAVNSHTRRENEASLFIEWFSEQFISYYYSLLTGYYINDSFRNDSQAISMYPWLKTIKSVKDKSITRLYSTKNKLLHFPSYDFDRIIHEIISSYIKNKTPIKELLQKAQEKYSDLTFSWYHQ